MPHKKEFFPLCSQHFHGGKKQGSTDVPAIFSLLISHSRGKYRSCLRQFCLVSKKRKSEAYVTSKPQADALVEEVSPLCELICNVDSDRNKN